MMVALGIILIVGQVIVILLLRGFVKAFSNYTAAFVAAQASSVRIHERQEALTAHLRKLSEAK